MEVPALCETLPCSGSGIAVSAICCANNIFPPVVLFTRDTVGCTVSLMSTLTSWGRLGSFDASTEFIGVAALFKAVEDASVELGIPSCWSKILLEVKRDDSDVVGEAVTLATCCSCVCATWLMTEFSIEPRLVWAETKWLVEIWLPLPGITAVFMSGINPASFTFILL